jgi:hypothetical protein
MGLGNLYKSVKNALSPVEYTAPAPKPISEYYLKDRGVKLTDADFEAAKPILYGEISNRPADKQMLEANVIMNTGLNRMQGYGAHGKPKTLAEVFSMPNQYQAYNSPQYQQYYNPMDAPSKKKKEQIDKMVDDIRERIKNGEFVDNTEGAYYYIHEKDGKIKYDNLRKLFAS